MLKAVQSLRGVMVPAVIVSRMKSSGPRVLRRLRYWMISSSVHLSIGTEPELFSMC